MAVRFSRFARCWIKINFFSCSLDPNIPNTFFVFSPITICTPRSVALIELISVQRYVQSTCNKNIQKLKQFSFLLNDLKFLFYLPSTEYVIFNTVHDSVIREQKNVTFFNNDFVMGESVTVGIFSLFNFSANKKRVKISCSRNRTAFLRMTLTSTVYFLRLHEHKMVSVFHPSARNEEDVIDSHLLTFRLLV